jgi:hypothetical protein
MAVKPENTFRGSVHKHLPRNLYHEKMNNPFAAGIADDYYSGMKADLWVEYKFILVPKQAKTRIDLVSGKKPPLSPMQQHWLRERHREGRNVRVIVGCKEGGVIFADLEWETPITQQAFVSKLQSRADLASWILAFTQGGP